MRPRQYMNLTFFVEIIRRPPQSSQQTRSRDHDDPRRSPNLTFELLSFDDLSASCAAESWAQLEQAVGRPDAQRRAMVDDGERSVVYVQKVDGLWRRLR